MSDLVAIRCSSCLRQIAVSDKKTALRNSIYCDAWCFDQQRVSPMEVRNDHWKIQIALGASPVTVAREWGVPHSAVYKAIAK